MMGAPRVSTLFPRLLSPPPHIHFPPRSRQPVGTAVRMAQIKYQQLSRPVRDWEDLDVTQVRSRPWLRGPGSPTPTCSSMWRLVYPRLLHSPEYSDELTTKSFFLGFPTTYPTPISPPSRQHLRKKTNCHSPCFAYPFGSYSMSL